MGHLKSIPFVFFLFPLCFLIFATFFSLSNGAYDDHHQLQHAKIPEFLDTKIHHGPGIVERGTRRITAETTTQNSTYLMLAANRTHRRDPSDNFNYYTGGWNITDSHYLSSVAYSATGPFVVAIIWFLIFGVFLLCFSICCCFCRRKNYGYSRTAYAISTVSLTIFTLAAIAGTAFIYAGEERFHSTVVNTISYVLHEADNVIVNLKDLSDNLLEAKNSTVGQVLLPDELRANIDDIGKTIDDVATDFHNVTQKNSHDIRTLLHPLRLALICVASALLILAILGFLFSILGMGCLVYSLVVIGWILIAATFIMSGMFLLVHNVVADTCVAMDEWLQNPNANSSLESIIPKVSNQTAEDISSVTKGVTLGLISMVNGQITNVSNVDMPPNSGPLYYNQSGPLVPVLCNPYDSNLNDWQCAAGEVDFKNASQVWRKYVCQVSASGTCTTPGRITPDNYNQLTATVNVSNGLYTGMPFLVDLIDSTYLKQLFGDISKDYCPGLGLYTRWMYVGFVTSSAAVMLSLILWIIYARERRHRAYTKKVDSRSSAGNLQFGYNRYP